EVRAEVRAARASCAAAGMQLIVNDYWEIALDEGCDFVHLGQGDLGGTDLAALRRAGVRLGISTHDHEELERALRAQPDYVALGPIYPTRLKVMPWQPQGLERIREWKGRIGATALVAIGGLTLERIAGVFAAGADVAAVVTDIIRDRDPEARTRAWLAAARAACGWPRSSGERSLLAPDRVARGRRGRPGARRGRLGRRRRRRRARLRG